MLEEQWWCHVVLPLLMAIISSRHGQHSAGTPCVCEMLGEEQCPGQTQGCPWFGTTGAEMSAAH